MRLRFSSAVSAAVPEIVVIWQCTASAMRVTGCRSRCPPATSIRPAGAATAMACSASARNRCADLAMVSATRLVITCQVALALRSGDAAMVLCRNIGVLLDAGRGLVQGGLDGGGEVVLGKSAGVQH